MFFLFPFGKVKAGCSIAIYGCGEIGKSYIEQINKTKYCEIIVVADRQIEYARIVNGALLIPAIELTNYNFDKVVIASQRYNDEIYDSLLGLGVDEDAIVAFEDLSVILNESKKTPASFNWNNYYQNAEICAKYQFDSYINPFLKKYALNISLEEVLDFACGKGRIAEIFSESCHHLTCADINPESIEYCRRRFASLTNVDCITNSNKDIPIESNSVSFVYSWDAMVHFRYKDIDRFLSEFQRVLRKGGHALIHHSNLASGESNSVSEEWTSNPHFRSNLSIEDVENLAVRHGFSVVEQETIDWGDVSELDGITLLVKN